MSTSFIPASRNRLRRGYTIALVSALILSTTAIFIRYLTQVYGLPAIILAFWRDLIVSLSLLLGLAVLHPTLLKLPRQHIGYLLIFGFLLAVFNSLWTLSVAINGAAVATVLAYCSAAFTTLLGWWFFKEFLHWAKLVAVVLSLGGCMLVAGALDPASWRLNLLGSLVGILSGLLWASYSLLGRSASHRGLNPWTTLFYTFTFATVFLLIFNLLPGDFILGSAASPGDLFWLGNAWWGWLVLFFLAAGPTLAGFGLYNVALISLPASVVNLITTSEPVFTALIAFIVLGESLTGTQIIGSLLILGGVILLRLYEGWLENRNSKLEIQPGEVF
jgi:drug/metabolite transporter (DMT)-like permease